MFIGQERMRVRLQEGEGACVCTLESCHMGLTAQEVARKFLRISMYTEEYAHQSTNTVCPGGAVPKGGLQSQFIFSHTKTSFSISCECPVQFSRGLHHE